MASFFRTAVGGFFAEAYCEPKVRSSSSSGGERVVQLFQLLADGTSGVAKLCVGNTLYCLQRLN